VPVVLDPTTLKGSVMPQHVPPLLLDLAAAIAGAEAKLVRVELEELGVGPRDRLANGHPLHALLHRIAALLGVARPQLVLSTSITQPRLVAGETPWLVLPEAMVEQAQPLQEAMITRWLVRMALGVPWLDDFPSAYAHAVLCGAARQVVPGYAADVIEGDQQDLVDEFTRRVGRAIGRRQKKALSELVQALSGARGPTLADVAAFERAIAQTELRAAFVTSLRRPFGAISRRSVRFSSTWVPRFFAWCAPCWAQVTPTSKTHSRKPWWPCIPRYPSSGVNAGRSTSRAASL
jgi:hypothetical protein